MRKLHIAWDDAFNGLSRNIPSVKPSYFKDRFFSRMYGVSELSSYLKNDEISAFYQAKYLYDSKTYKYHMDPANVLHGYAFNCDSDIYVKSSIHAHMAKVIFDLELLKKDFYFYFMTTNSYYDRMLFLDASNDLVDLSYAFLVPEIKHPRPSLKKYIFKCLFDKTFLEYVLSGKSPDLNFGQKFILDDAKVFVENMKFYNIPFEGY